MKLTANKGVHIDQVVIFNNPNSFQSFWVTLNSPGAQWSMHVLETNLTYKAFSFIDT